MNNPSISSLKDEIRGKIADMERQRAQLPADRSDSEMDRFQLDSHIRDAEREISALNALQRGDDIWPSEQGNGGSVLDHGRTEDFKRAGEA